jgi:hypothetical protein
MNTDIAHPNLASCGTRLVQTKLKGSVRRPFVCLHTQSMPTDVCFFKLSLPFHQFSGELPLFMVVVKNIWKVPHIPPVMVFNNW